MKLTIVTINYNNKDGLSKTIESVLSQSFKDWEWIIIDGGSTDGSTVLIESVKNELAYYCSEADDGVYYAQNKGIDAAKGDYLCFLNSGDIFADSLVLERVFQNFIDADVIYGDWILVQGSNNIYVKSPNLMSIGWICNNNVCHQAMFIRRSCLYNNKYDVSYRLFADWRKWIDFLLLGKTFSYVPFAICFYDGSGLSSKKSELKEFERERLLNDHPVIVRNVLIELKYTYRRLSEYEDSILTKKTLYLSKESSAYAKIIHANLLFVEYIHKIYFYCKRFL